MHTPLDKAHAAMEAAPDDGAASLAFYEMLAQSELYLMLEEEAREDTAKAQVFETSDGRFALAFDTEERLAEFVDTPAPYVALSGRRIARLLAGGDVGLGINLGVAPSSTLLAPHALDWLASALGQQSETRAKARRFAPPATLPEALLHAIDRRLANMSGVVAAAYLCAVEYTDNSKGHMLALVDVPEAARAGISEAFAEALQFSGLEAASLDITFLPPDDPRLDAISKTGLGFDIPELVLPETRTYAPQAPGSDPDKPPKLR